MYGVVDAPGDTGVHITNVPVDIGADGLAIGGTDACLGYNGAGVVLCWSSIGATNDD